MPGPLDKVIVLDFSHALAGPFCTLLMAQYGADVYKIEPPAGGDIGRGWGPPFAGVQASYFLGLNSGKRSACIDLKQPEGVALCLRMIEKADVLIENFRPGATERLGLGYAAARERNPRLVYCSISGYGQDGPSRDEPAMDLILQASSGLMSVTGTEDGELVRCGHSVADVTAGMFALIGILMALRAREKTGVGQFVDVSMLDSMISAMSSNYGRYLGSGEVPGPLGTAFDSIVPYRTFLASDRPVAMAVGSERLWRIFCEDVIGRPDLTAHPDYATNALRVKNRRVLEPLLAGIFRQATAAEWVKRLSAAGVPCSPVRNIEEVVEDAQCAVRAMFPEVEHPATGRFRVTGAPVKLSETPGCAPPAAPLLGEHTREVLASLLGLGDAELDRLCSAGVLK